LPNDTLAYHLLRMKASKAMGDFARTYREMKVLHGDVWALHPNYRQAEAITLRMSCGKPNLQNVADDDSGKKKIDVPYRPRECFVPRPGCAILAPDYSQIEMWILMLRSGDQNLRKILLAGGDTHGRIAHNIWSSDFDLEQALKDKKKSISELKPAQLHNLKAYTNRRKRSKNIQFCKIYGGGPAKIGEMIGCTTGEAKQFITDWERMFPEVAGWMSEKVHVAKRHGWSENAFGYRIPVDRDLAYRSVNYDIQCSAAFVLKRAMNRVCTLSQEKQWLGKVDPLLTVHDELLIETNVQPETAKMRELMIAVTKAMQADSQVLNCPVPFPVGMKIVETRWAEAKEVSL
jgi:DNA polymerase-1